MQPIAIKILTEQGGARTVNVHIPTAPSCEFSWMPSGMHGTSYTSIGRMAPSEAGFTSAAPPYVGSRHARSREERNAYGRSERSQSPKRRCAQAAISVAVINIISFPRASPRDR